MKKEKQQRGFDVPFTATRADDGKRYIEGYFALYNSITELWKGCEEVIEPGAFSETLVNDIRVLFDHDTSKVLGRNKSGTAEFREDAKGLYAKVEVPDTTDGNNLYVLVSRGDVNQASFGFNILEEDVEEVMPNTYRWHLRKIDLHEVSIVTFPAYRDTVIHARSAEVEQLQARKLEQRKQELLKKVRR